MTTLSARTAQKRRTDRTRGDTRITTPTRAPQPRGRTPAAWRVHGAIPAAWRVRDYLRSQASGLKFYNTGLISMLEQQYPKEVFTAVRVYTEIKTLHKQGFVKRIGLCEKSRFRNSITWELVSPDIPFTAFETSAGRDAIEVAA